MSFCPSLGRSESRADWDHITILTQDHLVCALTQSSSSVFGSGNAAALGVDLVLPPLHHAGMMAHRRCSVARG